MLIFTRFYALLRHSRRAVSHFMLYAFAAIFDYAFLAISPIFRHAAVSRCRSFSFMMLTLILLTPRSLFRCY